VADAAPGEDLLSVGRVGRPHGLDGAFHVTQPRERVLNEVTSVIVNGSPVEITRRGGTSARPVLRLEGVERRQDAEALRGADLWVPRTATPPLEEDEWLAEDLVGCRVVDGARAVGVVARLLPYPSCDLLEVQRPDADPDHATKALLVPLIADAVRTVDVEAKQIDINLTFLGEDEA
jgi:16S rRNA processing protein RimM